MNTAAKSVLVRTKLTPREYAEFRKLAIDRGVAVSELAAEAMRAIMPAQQKRGETK